MRARAIRGRDPWDPDGEASASSDRGWGAGFRGLVANVFVALGSLSMGLWIVTTPRLRALGRNLVTDPQLVMLVAAMVVAVIAVLACWSAFGRAAGVTVGLVVAAHGVLATVMSLGSLEIVGRAVTTGDVDFWPIIAAMLAGVGVAIGLWHQVHQSSPRPRQLAGTTVATVVAVAAVGAPDLPMYVTGPARVPVLGTIGPFIGQAIVGLLIALLVTAGLRSRRSAAVGQSGAAIAMLGAATWADMLGRPITALPAHLEVAGILGLVAMAGWWATSGTSRDAGIGHVDDEFADDVDDELDDRGRWSATAQHDPHGPVDRDPHPATMVLAPVGDDLDDQPSDPDATGVIDVGDPTLNLSRPPD